MKNTVVLYGSTTGNTETIAKTIARELDAAIFDVATQPTSEIHKYQNLVLGTSTLGIGDLQDDWDAFLPAFKKTELAGKKIALFGLGDADMYPDSFVDGMGIIYKAIRDKGCIIIGQTDIDGYDFDDSSALVDGKFVGLPLDEDNQSDLTDERIESWVEQIKREFD
ncbi:flavodoxin [Maribellus maritimus]|uniref:flavodoxin n=1 Tax=Maribellus maritimus TaxID=2870838 RepID=UPI001EEC54BD|nr:flavodoxin [Maribellus maritimus]MCG6190271.1 flavodoxin [Maribellus maritimus]